MLDKTLSVKLNRPLLQALKIAAVKSERSISSLVAEALLKDEKVRESLEDVSRGTGTDDIPSGTESQERSQGSEAAAAP